MKDPITDTTSIDNAVGYVIVKAARHLKLHLQRSLKEFGMGPEQWFLLFRLYEQDGRSQKELADNHANDFPNITRLIDALVKKGYVQRKVDAADRRKQRVYLTQPGREFMETRMPWVVKTRQDIFKGISDEELFQLVQTLEKIEENLN
ncbi:MAG: MarR family winged helix-turn-helix transcriptional regulator [Anaerolineae bacterium]